MRARFLHSALGLLTAGTMFFSGVQTATAQLNPIKFKEYTLANGLHVILHEDNSAPVVATVVYYKVGSRDENPSRTGFAHFFEHLMFEGTPNIPRSAIGKYAQEAGGELNAYTTMDETVYFFEMPANEVQLPLWIEYQRMRQALVDTIGVETQRGVVKEERKMRYDNTPYGNWQEIMNAKMFVGTSYQWTPIGSAQHIDSASIAEFRAFYDNFYQPNNATLVVSGSFDEKTIRRYVDEYFGSYPKATEPKREPFKLSPLKESYRETVKDYKAQLPAVFIGFPGVKYGHEDYFALTMLNDILSSGESSRLYQRLVDKDQISAGCGTFAMALQNAGNIVAYGVALPGKSIEDVEKTMLNELQTIAANGISDAEFSKARNMKEAEFVSGKKDAMGKARELAKYHTYFGDANLINTEIEKYMKVTKEDIKRVAQKYFTNAKTVTITFVPTKPEKEAGAPSGK